MHSTTLFAGISLLAAVGYISALPNSDWALFKRTHGKVYETREEELLRSTIYNENKRFVEWFNENQAQQLGYTLKLNHLSDLTEAEYKRLNGFRLREEHKALLENSPEADKFLDSVLNDGQAKLPNEVDWRQVPGRVSPVKDQGNCGSCWSFATTGVLEGQETVRNATLKGRGLVALSEQDLMDCDYYDLGCDGGFMAAALKFVAEEGGLESSKDYPYKGYRTECKFKLSKVVFTDCGYGILKGHDEEKLKALVANFGPVAVAIDASGTSFQHYHSGVFLNPLCMNGQDDLDHAVLVVGYGTDPEQGDFWLVKNSWSSEWGDNGYIKMARNKGNHCGVATLPVIPTF